MIVVDAPHRAADTLHELVSADTEAYAFSTMNENRRKWRDYEEPLSTLMEALNDPHTGPSRSWTEINFYCWYQDGGQERGYIAQQAQHERRVMSRTLDGKLKLIEIFLHLCEVSKQNDAIVANLFKRLTLPKE